MALTRQTMTDEVDPKMVCHGEICRSASRRRSRRRSGRGMLIQFARATFAASLLLALVLMPNAEAAEAASNKDRVELILSHLPSKDSPEYKALKDLAGDPDV